MSEKLKDKLLLEIAQDLVLKFDTEISKDILNIINKHLYNYDVVEKQTSLITLDTKTERILKMYLGTKKLEGIATDTLKQYYREMRRLLAFLNCSMEDVTTNGIKIYLMTFKTERNLKDSTVENMRSYLNAVFSWAANEQYIKSNPCASIVPIKIKKEMRKSFSNEELKKIKDYCKRKPRDLALVNFLYSTGCRVSQVCSVNIKDVDFKEKKLIVLGKGNKERFVYLTDEAINALKDYLKTRNDQNEALFINYRKERISKSGVERICREMSKKLDIENIHPHRFRRTLATNLLDSGMAIQDVSKILGHANIAIAQKYYYHTDKKVETEFRKYI